MYLHSLKPKLLIGLLSYSLVPRALTDFILHVRSCGEKSPKLQDKNLEWPVNEATPN